MSGTSQQGRTIVIGAGIGGLSAALRLAGGGQDVEVIELADAPGGKLRTIPSVAGPVDAGPTVLTMLPVFERLFASVGARLSDHLNVIKEPLLARHWWPDGSSLDLHACPEASAAAVNTFGGSKAEAEFRRFAKKTGRMFEAFLGPVMQAPQPDLLGIAAAAMRNPGLLGELLPGRTMWRSLEHQFTDPRLRQLFGRYATYVGGSPFQSPALLSLIWHAEASGVWRVEGGMSKLAEALETLAMRNSARFRYTTSVDRIEPGKDGVTVILSTGESLHAGQVVFNGDPAALEGGLLGQSMQTAVKRKGTTPRSLSAWVWSFAATPKGRELAHHNVFFNADYQREFDAIAEGARPGDAALYVCAQDRGAGLAPEGPERFEIILNGAPVQPGQARDPKEYETCRTQTFEALSQRGLDFTPLPERPALTTPHDFAERFPASAGSLYGRSPHGMMATFQRPATRTSVPGLYLAGGGVHPGAGLPMAATSGLHAAEAILTDLASTSTSRRTAMRGGMSMDFPTTPNTASRSSGS